jgi:hypothetical protein
LSKRCGGRPRTSEGHEWICRLGHRHEVSILIASIGTCGRCRGIAPRAKVSMMLMRPPQCGQGCGSLSLVASAGSAWGVGTASSSRARKPSPCRCSLALRTMPVAAAVVGNGGAGTVLAARDMSAESRRAAALDRRHHLQLAEADMAGIGFAPCCGIVMSSIMRRRSRLMACPVMGMLLS